MTQSSAFLPRGCLAPVTTPVPELWAPPDFGQDVSEPSAPHPVPRLACRARRPRVAPFGTRVSSQPPSGRFRGSCVPYSRSRMSSNGSHPQTRFCGAAVAGIRRKKWPTRVVNNRAPERGYSPPQQRPSRPQAPPRARKSCWFQTLRARAHSNAILVPRSSYRPFHKFRGQPLARIYNTDLKCVVGYSPAALRVIPTPEPARTRPASATRRTARPPSRRTARS